MRVLIVAGGYLPGYKYGGPVRSLAALVEQLGDEIEFNIVTSGSDMGESQPYPDVQLDTWSRVGKAHVWYTMARRLSPWFWRRIIADSSADVVYLNSFMDPVSSAYLMWRKLHLVPQTPVVLAPRGEFALSALNVKSRKKKVFRQIARQLRLHKGITWQASAPAEAADISREQPTGPRIVIAPDLTISRVSADGGVEKMRGHARFVWVGRIARVKNLEGIFGYLGSIAEGSAHIDLYGPVEDGNYWQESLSVANTLPKNVTFAYRGEVSHERIPGALRQSHFFLCPSRGENFGHTVAEALDQGLPVVLSDQTPWRNLDERGVGWDIPLDDVDLWQEVLEHCIMMDNEQYQEMSARCRGYTEIWMQQHGGRQANLEMFQKTAKQPLSVGKGVG